MSNNEEKESMKTDESTEHEETESSQNPVDSSSQEEVDNTSQEDTQEPEEITVESLQKIVDTLQKQLVEQESRIHNLQEALQQSQKNSDELTVRLKSVSAAYKKEKEDQESFKLRLQRNLEYKESRRRGEVVKVLFEPLQNLRRSTAMMQKNDPENAKGLGMIIKSFMDGFHKLGLEELNPQGEKFDPNQHEALMQQPVDDPALDDVVVNVYAIGYRIEGLILKPAQVIVGSYTAPPQPETPKEEAQEEVPEEVLEEVPEEEEEDTQESMDDDASSS